VIAGSSDAARPKKSSARKHGTSAGIIFTNCPILCRPDTIPKEERKGPDRDYRESLQVKLEIQNIKGEWGGWIMKKARAKNGGTTLMISKPVLNECAKLLLTINKGVLSAEQEIAIRKGVLLRRDDERLDIVRRDQYSCKQAYEHGLIGPEIKVDGELWRWSSRRETLSGCCRCTQSFVCSRGSLLYLTTIATEEITMLERERIV
jgi:hypothetical protein